MTSLLFVNVRYIKFGMIDKAKHVFKTIFKLIVRTNIFKQKASKYFIIRLVFITPLTFILCLMLD